MEVIFELLLQIIFEVVIQGVFELGIRGAAEPFRRNKEEENGAEARPFNQYLAVFGYLFIGIVCGAISIWIFPMQLLKNPIAHYASLAITPIVLGFLVDGLGRLRETKGKEKMMLDRFSYGFVFALAMGLVRFWFIA